MSDDPQSPMSIGDHGEHHYMEVEDEDDYDMKAEGEFDPDRLYLQAPVQLWQQFAVKMRDAGSRLSADEEVEDLNAASAAVNKKAAERSAELGRLQGELKKLARTYEQAAEAAKRPEGVPTETEHHQAVHDLEQKQYQASKALSEEQSASGKKEVELGRLRGEKEETARWEVGADDWHDPQVLKLKLLSDLGFSLLPTAQSEPVKLVVRNESRADLHPVVIEPTRSKAYHANLLWNLASE